MFASSCNARSSTLRTAAARPPRSISSRNRVCRTQHRRQVQAHALVLVPTGSGDVAHLEGEEVGPVGAFTLSDGEYEVGRRAPAAIVIAIPTVSSRHAKLRIDGDKVSVTDLGSTNGTIVDGTYLDPEVETPLPVGAEVVFGDEALAAFRLQRESEPAPA